MTRLFPISPEKITPATAAPCGGACVHAGSSAAMGIVVPLDSKDEPCDAFFSAPCDGCRGRRRTRIFHVLESANAPRLETIPRTRLK